jgi:hypothetical protein
MEIKYYIPELEEFHPGFEYEIEMPYLGYIPARFGVDKISHPELDQFTDELEKIAHANVRVKELDQEDLEELGWESKGSRWYSLKEVPGELGYWTHVMFHMWGEDSPIIAYRGEPETAMEDQHLFVGLIRNKSEMKRLMKQIHLLV